MFTMFFYIPACKYMSNYPTLYIDTILFASYDLGLILKDISGCTAYHCMLAVFLGQGIGFSFFCCCFFFFLESWVDFLCYVIAWLRSFFCPFIDFFLDIKFAVCCWMMDSVTMGVWFRCMTAIGANALNGCGECRPVICFDEWFPNFCSRFSALPWDAVCLW